MAEYAVEVAIRPAMAFEDFVAVHGLELGRFALLVTADPTDAQDVVQDVLIAVYPKWERIGSLDEPLAYLRRAIINRQISLRRRLRHLVALDEGRADPPDPTRAAPLELLRNGFDGSGGIGGGIAGTDSEVLVTVPDLLVWSSGSDTFLSQAVILRTPTDDGVDDYTLGSSAPGLRTHLAVGAVNPWAKQPESRFLFTTNVGNIGGAYEGDGWATVVTILGGVRPNPDFAPTQPVDNGSGEPVIEQFEPMSVPEGWQASVTDDWETLEVPEANLAVRYPGDWVATDQGDGVIWITAPSGYIVDLLTNSPLEKCVAGDLPGSERLGTVSGLQAKSTTTAGEPEIRWQNGGEFPVWAGLVLAGQDQTCFEWYLDFGGKQPVYLGSADNSANPTDQELEQALGILASARRLG